MYKHKHSFACELVKIIEHCKGRSSGEQRGINNNPSFLQCRPLGKLRDCIR